MFIFKKENEGNSWINCLYAEININQFSYVHFFLTFVCVVCRHMHQDSNGMERDKNDCTVLSKGKTEQRLL